MRRPSVKVHWLRQNPVFFERDGSFNPFFLMIGVLCGVLVWLLVRTWQACADNVVKVALLSVLAVTINIFVMAAVSQAKAKIIANARSTGAIAHGVTDAIRPFGGKADDHDVDETAPV